MEGIQDILKQTQRRNEDDAWRFEALDPEQCMACHARGADKRSLVISCGYDVSEVIPEAIKLTRVDGLKGRGWYLCICKSCRASLLRSLGDWWDGRVDLRNTPKNHDGHPIFEDHWGAYIPVRQHGAVTMMTLAEWERYRSEQDFNA